MTATKITIDNFAFVPPMLRVKAGTTVTWVNGDDIPHSIVCPPLSVHSHPMDTDEIVQLHVREAGALQLPLRAAPVHAWAGGGVGVAIDLLCHRRCRNAHI